MVKTQALAPVQSLHTLRFACSSALYVQCARWSSTTRRTSGAPWIDSLRVGSMLSKASSFRESSAPAGNGLLPNSLSRKRPDILRLRSRVDYQFITNVWFQTLLAGAALLPSGLPDSGGRPARRLHGGRNHRPAVPRLQESRVGVQRPGNRGGLAGRGVRTALLLLEAPRSAAPGRPDRLRTRGSHSDTVHLHDRAANDVHDRAGEGHGNRRLAGSLWTGRFIPDDL